MGKGHEGKMSHVEKIRMGGGEGRERSGETERKGWIGGEVEQQTEVRRAGRDGTKGEEGLLEDDGIRGSPLSGEFRDLGHGLGAQLIRHDLVHDPQGRGTNVGMPVLKCRAHGRPVKGPQSLQRPERMHAAKMRFPFLGEPLEWWCRFGKAPVDEEALCSVSPPAVGMAQRLNESFRAPVG